MELIYWPSTQKTGEARAVADWQSYPIVVEVEYKLVPNGGFARSGHGWTTSLSSKIIQFAPEKPLPSGRRVDLSIAWPALLNYNVPLRSHITGSIVKSRTACVTVEILRYEFRTRGLNPSAGEAKPMWGL